MNSIKDIEVNNRFIRSDNMISLKSEDRNIFLFPIKDIYLDTTFYYLYKGYNSILVYGPKLDYENVDITKTAIFTEEHNRFIANNIVKNIKNEDNDLGKYDSYYYIKGLLVYKKAIEEIRDNIL